MAAAEADDHARRSVVPKQIQAARSLWPAAVWTGLGAAIVCATLAIVVVAACWLPVSGTTGRTNSAIRAGLLTFLAALHGGVTVDGVSAAWLPLGMTVIVGLTAWRAGSGLADAAHQADERDSTRLLVAGIAQVLSFTVGCLVAVPFASLGTSRAPMFGVGVAAVVLFSLTGGAAFVRSSALRESVLDSVPAPVRLVLRAGAAAAAVYLVAGAGVAAASLVLHQTAAERLSSSVGGGIGGIPVLLLGVLAAPNAAIATASFLAGPGFALGTGTHVWLFGSAHGVLPAFPILAAVPTGRPNPATFAVAALVPLVAGGVVARMAGRSPGLWRRVGTALAAALAAGATMFLLGWQGGGAVGEGRLRAVGASPWQLGAAVAAGVAVIALLGVAVATAWQAMLGAEDDEEESLVAALRFPRLTASRGGRSDADDDRRNDLAG